VEATRRRVAYRTNRFKPETVSACRSERAPPMHSAQARRSGRGRLGAGRAISLGVCGPRNLYCICDIPDEKRHRRRGLSRDPHRRRGSRRDGPLLAI